ncbi:MAG: hypothetical protein IPO05_16465 [Flavobacteriales bacterium]|nr:hypothetical protein [Flavobacteriales bacterium]
MKVARSGTPPRATAPPSPPAARSRGTAARSPVQGLHGGCGRYGDPGYRKQQDAQQHLTNSGTINWGAGTWIGTGNVQNATGGVFNINFDSFGQLQVPVVNTGAVNHTVSGNFATSTTFTNSSGGSVNVNAGTWTFATAWSNAGTLNIPTGRTLFVTSAGSLNAGSAFTGAGTFSVSSTVTQNTPWTNTTSILLLEVGAIWNTTTGNGTTIAPGGTLTWNSGTIAGPAGFTVAAGATATLATANNKTLNSTLTNSGTINWGAGTWIGDRQRRTPPEGCSTSTSTAWANCSSVVNSGAVNHTQYGNFTTSHLHQQQRR